jgi:hypothetical protein
MRLARSQRRYHLQIQPASHGAVPARLGLEAAALAWPEAAWAFEIPRPGLSRQRVNNGLAWPGLPRTAAFDL